jgi:hypothetical protein
MVHYATVITETCGATVLTGREVHDGLLPGGGCATSSPGFGPRIPALLEKIMQTHSTQE